MIDDGSETTDVIVDRFATNQSRSMQGKSGEEMTSQKYDVIITVRK